VWYFTPFYAMLRAIPDKLFGVIIMGAAVMILFVIPWLDRSPVRSIKYRGPISRFMLGAFVVAFVFLGYAGYQAPSEMLTLFAQIATAFYFLFFITMPFWTRIDSVKPVPERVPTHA
jgi:ubiquinol-cytochrome c reductase cytochrome b subunit